MNPLRMPSLKASQLKYLAFLTGISSSGTKATIESALLRSLSASISQHAPSQDHGSREACRRVVSIDMGIRNLAYCELQFPIRRSLDNQTKFQPLQVKEWQRMDLLESSQSEDPVPLANEEVEATPRRAVAKRSKSKSKIVRVIDKEAFIPPRLARTAHGIINNVLALDPDVILIERQRFRSGGAAAIQEWTVRVNMLESMLWACLETQRNFHHSQRFPETHAINPRRVADFWVPGTNIPRRPVPDLFSSDFRIEPLVQAGGSGRKKIEKKDKVDVVRSWILDDADVDIEFSSNDTASIADAFTMDKANASIARGLAGGKLDDLADCLLQAVAYVRWEENKQAIREMLQD